MHSSVPATRSPQREWVFQLTCPRGRPKYPEVVQGIIFCGLEFRLLSVFLCQTKICCHTVGCVSVKAGLRGECGPVLQCRADFAQQILRSADAEPLGFLQHVLTRNVFKFSVHAHQVLVGPFATGVISMRYVIAWRKFPCSSLLQAKCKVLRVVVTVPRHNIESHSAKYLIHGGISKAQLRGHNEELSIGVRAALLEVQVIHSAKCLHMVLDSLVVYYVAIEPAR